MTFPNIRFILETISLSYDNRERQFGNSFEQCCRNCRRCSRGIQTLQIVKTLLSLSASSQWIMNINLFVSIKKVFKVNKFKIFLRSLHIRCSEICRSKYLNKKASEKLSKKNYMYIFISNNSFILLFHKLLHKIKIYTLFIFFKYFFTIYWYFNSRILKHPVQMYFTIFCRNNYEKPIWIQTLKSLWYRFSLCEQEI